MNSSMSTPRQHRKINDQSIPKLPPAQPKENKCIRFSKDGDDKNSVNAADDNQEPLIDLVRVVAIDIPYGKCTHKDPREAVEKKKKHMLLDDYFSSTVNKDQCIDMSNLPEYFVITPEEAKRKADAIFSSILIDPKRLDTVRKNLSSFELYEKKGPVGPLVSVDCLTFLLNTEIKAMEQSFEEMKKSVTMSRMILNDGNSFYRTFMFGLLEHQILYGEVKELNKIAIGIYYKVGSKILKKRNPTININEALIILHLIIIEVSEKRFKAGYDLLITAINQSKNFDYALIKFMKIAIAEYIQTNAQLIFKSETWEEIGEIAAPSYLSNHSFDYASYIDDRILAMDYGADKFVVQISPVIFRINLNLYAIEGTANEVKHIVYLKQYFHCMGDLSFHNSISIFYSFSRFQKLYYKGAMEFHEGNISFRDTQTSFDHPRFQVVTPNAQCNSCKETSDIICFDHIPRVNFCKKCLVDMVDRVITKRIYTFSHEYYNNREYYFRYISLSDKFEDKLEEEDFIALFNRNIAQQTFYIMARLCFKCLKQQDNPHTMVCNCNYCNRCLIDNIMKATNQQVILNQYEKTNMTFKLVKCSCGLEFDTNKAIDLVYQERLPQLEKEAILRLAKTAEIVCSFCGKLHETAKYSKAVNMNTNIKSGTNTVIKFNVLNEKNTDNTNYLHIMCRECLKDLRSDKENKVMRHEIAENSTFYPLQCKVCIKTHQIEDKKLTESKNQACCIIY